MSDQKFALLESRVAALESKLDSVEKWAEDMRSRIAAVEAKG